MQTAISGRPAVSDPKPLMRTVVGRYLRAHRKSLTLRDVSNASGIALGYLSEIERGSKQASDEIIIAICDTLGIKIQDMYREIADWYDRNGF